MMRTCALKDPLIRLDIDHFRPMKRGHEVRGMAGIGPVGGAVGQRPAGHRAFRARRHNQAPSGF